MKLVQRIVEIVWYLVGLLTALLLIRFVLALLGANLANQFASWIYTITDPFVTPFRGLLQIGQFHAGIGRIEVETIVAIIVYAIIGWAISSAIELARKN